MALSLTELQAITDAYVESTSNDIYFKSNVLLYKLLGGETGNLTIPGGKTIDVVLEYDGQNGGSYGNTTKLNLAKKEIFNKASFRWAAEYVSIIVDFEDQRQNAGDLAIVNLIEGKLRNAQKTIRTSMGGKIYTTAADGDSINGLGDLFNTTTSTAYGGIAEDDMAEWAAIQYATAGVMGFTTMQAIRRQASIDDNMESKPNLYITCEALKDKFESSLQTQARYSDVKLVDAGFDNILFGGAPVVSDNKYETNVGSTHVDGLNLNYLDVLTHQKYNFTPPKWASPVDQPDTLVSSIRWAGNLICRNRQAHVRATGITTS